MAENQKGEKMVMCQEKGEESYNKMSFARIFVWNTRSYVYPEPEKLPLKYLLSNRIY